MGGQMPGQPRRGEFEDPGRARAQQLIGLFGSPEVTQMIQRLMEAGALQAGAGGTFTGQGPSVQAPALQTGQGGLMVDVGTLPPSLQSPAAMSPVAPGVVPPSLAADVRAPGQPVPPVPAAPAPSPAVGGLNIPQWLAEIIGAITAGAGPQQETRGPSASQGGGQFNIFEGAAPKFGAFMPGGLDQGPTVPSGFEVWGPDLSDADYEAGERAAIEAAQRESGFSEGGTVHDK